ncbi:hypothetical protein ACRAWB_18255 [Leifsonia poae]|uniref:hypothetical protein n=1 Tax=Leifsonia poae TaxID=110933 RepID=UPI003D687F76
MTTIENEGPLPALFSGDLAQLNTDSLFHEVAATVDGYGELVATYERIQGSSAFKTKAQESVPFGQEIAIAAERVLDGGGVVKEAQRIQNAAVERELQEIAAKVENAALTTFASRSNFWVWEAKPAIAEALEERLQELYSRARQLARGPLRGVYQPEEAMKDPSIIPAFVELGTLSHRFGAILRTTEALFADMITERSAVNQGDPWRWPLSHLVRDYEKAWPHFYLRLQLDVTDGGTTIYGSVPHELPAWREAELKGPGNVLRFLAERDVELWVPKSNGELSAHRRAIDELSEKRREEHNRRAIDEWRGKATVIHG